MATIYSQDYESETTGVEPSGFNKFVGTRLSYEASTDYALNGSKSLKITSVTLDHDGYWVASGAKAGDFVVSTAMRCNDVAGNRFGLIVRGFTDAGTEKGYGFMLRTGNSIRLIELRGGAETVLNTTAISSISDDTWYHLEITIKGYTIECRYWADGGSRPSTADITVTNEDSFHNAYVGVGHYGFLDSADIIYADDLLVESIDGHEAVIVSASSDDARNLNGATQKNTTVTTQYLGKFTTTNDYWNGWRWDNVAVPQGATIDSAILDLFSAGVTGGSSVSIILYGVDEDDTVTFNTSTQYPEGKTRTTANATKTLTVSTWSTSGFNKETIDVTSLIQEIVDRGSWASGNALAIVAHDNGSSSSNYVGNSSYDSSADRGAKLTIEYSTGTDYTKDLSETVTVTDALVKQDGKFLSEAVSVVDSISKTVSRTLSETVTVVDSLLVTIAKYLSETITVVDTLSKVYSAVRSFTETVSVTDTILKTTQKVFSETVTVTDAAVDVVRSALISLAESLTIRDKRMDRAVALTADDSMYFTSNSTDFDIAGDMTILARVKLYELPSTGGLAFDLVTKDDVGVDRSYSFLIKSDDKLRFFFTSGMTGTPNTVADSNVALGSGDLGNWIDLAVVVAASAPTITFYIDGSSTGVTYQSSAATSIYNSAQELAVGARQSSGSWVEFFEGLIDYVYIFDRTLSGTEITDFLDGEDFSQDANLVALYNFDGNGTDDSGNGNTLTAVGSPNYSGNSGLVVTLHKALSDALTVVDSVYKTAGKLLSETITVVDTIDIIKGAVLSLVEAVTVVDTVNRATTRAFTETVTVMDSVSKQAGKLLSETLTVVDFVEALKSGVIQAVESITVSDTLSRVWSTSRSFVETVSVTDTVSKLTARAFTESLSVIDSISNGASKLLTETVSVVDNFVRSITRSFTETVTITDVFDNLKSATISLVEALSITDKFKIFKNGLLSGIWEKMAKLTASWTKKAKETTSWTKQSKNSADWTKQPKPD